MPVARALTVKGVIYLMEQHIIDGYVEDASFLIPSFEAIPSSDLLANVVDFIPDYNCRVIDIGAGTGRDAAWLASQGLNVSAIEPVSEFRQAGKSLHPSALIEWFNDSLPSLSLITQLNEKYELALLISVWQHVPESEKITSLTNIHSILNENGRLIISVRNGPGSINRKCYATSAEETITQAQQCGFKLIFSCNALSAQKGNIKSKVTWTWLVFNLS